MLKPPSRGTDQRDFLDTVDDLDAAIHMAQIMREIDELSTQSEDSNSDKLSKLKIELEATRKQLRFMAVD